VIPRNVRLSEAPSHGKPISSYSPDSTGAAAYSALSVELRKRDGRIATAGPDEESKMAVSS
jgi:chromosome partitioning protein